MVLGIDIEHIANDKVGAVLLLGLDEVLDGVWFQQVVRIGEEDEIAGGGVQANVARRRRTAVFAVQHPDAGIPRSPGITHFGAAVGAAVIHQQYFQVGTALPHHTAHTSV